MDIGETRRRSAALFGNEKVAEVVLGLAGAPGEQATAQQLASGTQISHGMVRDVLLRLTRADVLTALPKVGGSRAAQYYAVRDSALWEALCALARTTAVESDTPALPETAPSRRPI